jgi:hypothetical protein
MAMSTFINPPDLRETPKYNVFQVKTMADLL